MKIATELHRPTWVSLPLVDAILRDDVLISFITPPEFQTEPLFDIKQPMFLSPYIILGITIFPIFVLHKAIINNLKSVKTMKKLISLVAMMFIASLTMFASAQDIVGKWRVDTEAIVAGTEMEDAKFDMVFTYAEDKSGTCNVVMDMTQPIDATTKMRIELRVDLSFRWELEGDQLTSTPSDIDIELGDISFIPSNPEQEAAIPMLRQMFEQQFKANKEQIAKEIGIESGTLTIESLTADRMVIIGEKGDRSTLIRIE